MKRCLAILVGMATVCCAYAAGYEVKGRVVAKEDSQPCPGATYHIYNAKDTVKFISANVTDVDGNIKQSISNPGKYVIKVEFLGMKPYVGRFDITKSHTVADLGVIYLNSDAETLGEVVITGKKQLVETDGATLTYNVEEDPEASINTTIEMLRKVPMVSVDADDNIQVNGSSSFKLLLNGREDPMLQGDVKTILRSMPAATIKKIEVITEPGAKYDAEGTGGILNIITTGKQTLEGYLANLSLRGSNSYWGGSAYARAKYGNVTASANFNFSQMIDIGYAYSSFITTESLNGDSEHWRYTDAKSKTKSGGYNGGNINLSWEPDTLNLFSVQANIGNWKAEQYSPQSIWAESEDLVMQWRMKRDTDNDNNSLWSGANASFQHTFGREGHHIIGSYIFGYSDDNSQAMQRLYDLVNYSETYNYRRDIDDGYHRRNAAQLDYANPFNGKHKLEAGFKGSWNRDYNNRGEYVGATEATLAPVESQHLKMGQIQDIVALYAAYTGDYGKWNARAGLRYEHTRMGIRYYTGGYEDFTSNFNDLVPNLAVSYKLTGSQNMRLAYQMRITRPSLWDLNPYRNTSNPAAVSYGNPDLDSEHYNSVTLSYSNYGGKLGGRVGVSYDRTDNSVQSYSFMENNILHTTYANIGHRQNTSANVNLQWSGVRMLNVGVNGSVRYVDYRADSELLKVSNHGWQGNYGLNADYTFPFLLRLSAYAGGGSGWIGLQTKGAGYYYYSLSLSRSFLKEKRLTVSAYGSNFLQPYRTTTSTTEAETFRQVSSNRYRQWNVGVSVSIRLGSLKQDVKSTAADLDTDTGSRSSESASANN